MVKLTHREANETEFYNDIVRIHVPDIKECHVKKGNLIRLYTVDVSGKKSKVALGFLRGKKGPEGIVSPREIQFDGKLGIGLVSRKTKSTIFILTRPTGLQDGLRWGLAFHPL